MRRVALIVTGISGAIAVVAGLITWFVEESVDPMHPMGNAGWLAFPAGFVAVGGLIAFLGDAVLASTTRPREQDTASPHPVGTHRPVRAPRSAVLAYAICLFVGALGAIAFTVHARGGVGVVFESFVFLCAAVFLWGVMRLRRPTASPGQIAGIDEEPVRRTVRRVECQVLRQWGLALTGVGAGIAVALYWFIAFVNHFFWAGVLFGPIILLGFGSMVAASGLAVVILDELLRLTGRRY